MKKEDNPFEPGAGTKPPELVGRDVLLEDADAAIAKGLKGRPIRGQVFYGLRGVGKTVLLREVSELATKRGALVSDLEAPEKKSLTSILGTNVRKLIVELDKTEQAKEAVAKAAGALQAFASAFKIKVAGIGIEVKKPKGVADSGDIDEDIADLLTTVAEAAQAQGTAVILAIDEMQYLSEAELAALITAIHRVNQKSLPLGLFGAGLPQLLAMAGNAKSYSERLFQFEEVDKLTEKDAKKAIKDPVEEQGIKIDAEALQLIYDKSLGYPYFLQEWGFRTWNVAQESPITKADVQAAEDSVIVSLDKSFFRVRFDRLSKGEQDYLRAMAELGAGPHKSGDVARVLGKKVNQVGPVRSQVIAKGMAYGGQYGIIHFSVPLFHEFMRRAMPEFKDRSKTQRRTKPIKKKPVKR